MSRPQRIAQYLQRLSFEAVIRTDEHDDRPDDAPPRAPEPARNYPSWNPTAFTAYEPFRG